MFRFRLSCKSFKFIRIEIGQSLAEILLAPGALSITPEEPAVVKLVGSLVTGDIRACPTRKREHRHNQHIDCVRSLHHHAPLIAAFFWTSRPA